LKLLQEYGKPYEIALVAYALMLSKASQAEAAFGILASKARTDGRND
jgi:CD109 antigen